MGNGKTILNNMVLLFVLAGLYAGFSPAYGQESAEIDPKKLFEYRCATCHGKDGKGTKRGLALKSPNFADTNWQASKKDEELVNSITNGRNKMPPWREKLKPEEIDALAKYVRKFVTKKSS